MFRPLPMLERLRRRYGDTFRLDIPSEPTWVVLSDPDDVRTVFRGDPRLLHAGAGNQILAPILGHRSVLLLDEDEHLQARKLLLPPFHGERMKRHLATMEEVAREEVARWPEGEPFRLLPRMQDVTLEVIVRVVFGVTESARVQRLRSALQQFLEGSTDVRMFFAFAVLGPDRITRLPLFRRYLDPVDALLREEIALRRTAPDLEERDDVLSMLVGARNEDGEPMGDEELRDELMTLLVAGHETTASALSWAFERLVRHPDKLARLASGDEAYLDASVQETLRRRPVVPLVLRKLAEPMEIGGHLLPAGVAVSPNVHLVHHREDVYPDPYAFRPERFLDTPPGTYTWIPFGGGVRRCLGASFALQEMRTVLRAVVERVSLEPAEARPEHVTRRAITWTPDRGGEVVARAA